MLVVYLAAVLSATARSPRPVLRVAVLAAAAAVLGWWIPMLASGTVRANPHASLLIVGAVVLGSLAIVGGSNKSLTNGIFAALIAGAGACLLIFVTSVGTYAVRPDLVPDIAGSTCCAGGLTAADRTETNRIESTDPYIAELVLGAGVERIAGWWAGGVASPRSQSAFTGAG